MLYLLQITTDKPAPELMQANEEDLMNRKRKRQVEQLQARQKMVKQVSLDFNSSKACRIKSLSDLSWKTWIPHTCADRHTATRRCHPMGLSLTQQAFGVDAAKSISLCVSSIQVSLPEIFKNSGLCVRTSRTEVNLEGKRRSCAFCHYIVPNCWRMSHTCVPEPDS